VKTPSSDIQIWLVKIQVLFSKRGHFLDVPDHELVNQLVKLLPKKSANPEFYDLEIAPYKSPRFDRIT
jgi:hypothetical protein